VAKTNGRKKAIATEARAHDITEAFDNLIDYMHGRALVASALLFVGCAPYKPAPPAESAYAPSGECKTCHVAIAQSYQHVAMARSLYRPTRGNVIEDYTRNNHIYHPASERHYRMVERQGNFYQQRYQLDERGREINFLEVEITYVIGSGNHARSYLHLSPTGEATELPVTWYSQEHRWGMSPGYDRPRHPDFSRPIDYACMFCHDATPNLARGADRYGSVPRFPQELPEGIDCQRCHGPGARHIELASSGRAKPEQIREAIVQPAKLSPELQMDVCQQCHLETTSAKLPQAVARFNRPAYSFRPGQRLGDLLVHFDHPPDAGREEKFEIVSAAYRLRKSMCYQKSGGRLTCISCHDPHRPPGDSSNVCRTCHSQVTQPHPDLASSNCAGCHMPKRRTEDVVHVVVTDHRIQRPKPGRDFLAPLTETESEYHGDIALYDPSTLNQPDHDVYLGIGLVKDGADRSRGIALLEGALAGRRGAVEAYIELGVAYESQKKPGAAAEDYRKALEIDPQLTMVRYDLARALAEIGNTREAREQYEQVIREAPDLAEAHNNLGTLMVQQGELARAADEYRSAIRARSIYAEAHNNLGHVYLDQGRFQDAQTEVEEALRCDPVFAPAYNSLGIILGSQDRIEPATRNFARAVQLDPSYAEAHYNLGRALHAGGKRENAILEYRRAIQLDPGNAPAHLGLGIALEEGGQIAAAIAEFREALRLRPGYLDARRNLDALERRNPGE